MEYAICTVPAAPVRKEPSHRTEMVNQLLFGETMEVLETKDEWHRIRTIADQYEGWLTYHLISGIDMKTATAEQNYFAPNILNSVAIGDQQMNIPMGSVLTGFDEGNQLLWNSNFKYTGDCYNTSKPSTSEQVIQTAKKLINAPYLWGGKTIMGIDCSGFAQTVFRLNGIKLLRDAHQQAVEGETVQALLQAREGDLAFFHNENGKVIHVGILLSPEQIIHASGKVRIDTIDEEGIVNSENGKRTHHLHSIRRMMKRAKQIG